MFSFEKDTMTMVAVCVCIAATIYLFSELNKAKSDVHALKGVSMDMMHALNSGYGAMPDEDDEEEEEVPVAKSSAAENLDEK